MADPGNRLRVSVVLLVLTTRVSLSLQGKGEPVWQAIADEMKRCQNRCV